MDFNNNEISESVSAKTRKNGNELLRQLSQDSNCAPCLKTDRLMKCLRLYQTAINQASTRIDLTSALKNHSVVSFELFKWYKENHQPYMVIHYAQETLSNNQKAIENSSGVQSLNWQENLKSKQIVLGNEYYEFVVDEVKDEHKRIDLMIRLKNKATFGHLQCHLNYLIAEMFLKSSIRNVDDDLNISFKAINECNYHYEECERYFKHNNYPFDFEISELDANRIIQMCTVEGRKYKRTADFSVEGALHGEECLNLEKVWDSIDTYHVAICRTKNKDIELEAEILSKLGLIYKQILKMNDRAKGYFNMCFNLAETMKPKLFTNHSWYKRCCNAIEEYQKMVVREEEEINKNNRAMVIEEIREDLEKIKKKYNESDQTSFIQFAYTDYPPKNGKKAQSTELKKLAKQSLIDYHPDKNSIADHGLAWHFISQEISKYCAAIHENLKDKE